MSHGEDSTINDVRDHRVLVDGCYYWIVRVNPADAAARGIRRHDPIKVFTDRGGCINLLTPSLMMIKQSHAMASSSCLVEVARWNGGG